jgi:predicted alpha/beta-hydrolase family hydrolase
VTAAGLLLWPGASATRNHPALVAIDDAVSALGIEVRRLDFPNPRARQPVLLDAIAKEAEAMAARSLWLGGRSFGGRMCSLAVAEGLPAKGLVLISYPLHAPGRPDRLRAEHFPALRVPCLFVSGSRDAFGSPEELEAATAAIPGPVTHRWVEGKDHGMRGAEAEVAAAVAGWLKRRRPAVARSASRSARPGVG